MGYCPAKCSSEIKRAQREEFYRGGVEAFSPTPMLLARRHFPAGTQGQTYWYHLDGRGSIAGLTKHQGQSTHNYRYDAYGLLLPANGSFTDPHNHYTFAGKEWDEHLGLYEFGIRLYDPWAGVWLTREPLPAQAWEPRTWHRYQYAYASPISYYDLYGMLIPIPPWNPTARLSSLEPHAPHRAPWPAGSQQDCSTGIGPVTRFILGLPGTPETWSDIATGLDIVAWVLDLFSVAAVTYGGIAGAGIPAVFLPEGVPEVPVVTGLAGMGIAELYVQPLLQFANAIATLSAGATLIAETKAGYTCIEQGQLGVGTKNAITYVAIGWKVPEAYSSLLLQSLAVANDLGWIHFPWPKER